jgi:subtilisin family serine protease
MSGAYKALITIAVLLAVIFLSGTESGTAAADIDVLSPEVQTAVDNLAPQETMVVIVDLKGEADLESISATNPDMRRRKVVEELKTETEAASRKIEPYIDTLEADGEVKRVVPLWITISLAVTATPEGIEDLATSPEVTAITDNETIPQPTMPTATTTTAPEANLEVIGAPALWDLGITGRNVVVASMDTGVDANHPDLFAQWRGGTNSWFGPSGEHPSTPTDPSGHGTWVMGVMAGRDAGGTSIGVAPDARWISAKIFNDRGLATTVGIHRSFQWLLDPDGDPATPDTPDVVNASWALPNPGCDLEFQPDLQALTAGEILPIFAAGNYGPNPSTSASPANNPEAFAVGAVNNSGMIYQYSSRGASSCGEAQTTFPEVMAPGVDIRTTDLFGLYTTATGTSISAPHAAGVLALLLSARPNLTAAEQRAALTRSAFDLGLGGPDNDYGFGRINALVAYDFAADQPPLAVVAATPTSGPAPLEVAFDGSGSSDPDPDDTLTYAWDLDGDGAYDDSTSALATHTYAIPGSYTVGLEVTDSHGASDADSVTIDAYASTPPDTTPPSIDIVTPADGSTYTRGQAVNASYSCQDEAGGSGLSSCEGPVMDGSAIDTVSAGSKTFTVRAMDNSGNEASVTNTYTVADCTVIGTPAGETLTGTAGDDIICAGGGDDIVRGLGGNDILRGQGGTDKLIGATGHDILDGGSGVDIASYSTSLTAITASLATNRATGEGSDMFIGIENIIGSSKADTLTGSDANNTLTGGDGNDTEYGVAGSDTVIGSGGADKLLGGGGNDTVNSRDGTSGNDSLAGGPGMDTKVTDATEKSIVGFP